MKKAKENKFTFRQNIGLILRGYKVIASFDKPVLLSMTVSSMMNAAVPFINIYFSARILNELTGARNQNALITLVAITISLNLIFMALKSVVTRWMSYCNESGWSSLIKVFADKLLSMDYIDIENPKIQQQYSEIFQHQNSMGFGLSIMVWIYQTMISGIIRIVFSIAMAFTLFTLKTPASSPLAYLDSPFAVMAVIAILLCSIFLAPYLSVIGGRIWAKIAGENNKSNRIFFFYYFHLISGTDRAKDIRIYDQKRLIDNATTKARESEQFEKYAKYDAKYSAASTALSYLANGLIYLFVALKAFAGAFGIGSIVQYVGAITQFGSGFASLFTNIGDLINNNVYLEKCFAFLDIPNKKYQGTLSVEKRDDNEYTIEFRNVSFKYPGTDTYALKNLNFKFVIGQRIAVVGMNGSGKTTMIKLLCRLYDPTEGIITLNGIDIKKYNYDEYMAIFSVVFQDFKLLPFTLGQNVAASVDYDGDQVTQTLSKAGFDTRLDSMTQGIETYLYKDFADEGVEISGGEAQKIALARALYKNAPFIVLDEPTAALDPVAEFEIYSKFNEIVGDKTAIYISHRLSSCRFCDDIVVFHNGEMIQRGKHEELVSAVDGKYYELWNAQAQYYTETAPEIA